MRQRWRLSTGGFGGASPLMSGRMRRAAAVPSTGCLVLWCRVWGRVSEPSRLSERHPSISRNRVEAVRQGCPSLLDTGLRRPPLRPLPRAVARGVAGGVVTERGSTASGYPGGFDHRTGPLARWTPGPFWGFSERVGLAPTLEPGPHGRNGRRHPHSPRVCVGGGLRAPALREGRPPILEPEEACVVGVESGGCGRVEAAS